MKAAEHDPWGGLSPERLRGKSPGEIAELVASVLRGIDERLSLEVSEQGDGHEAVVSAGGDPELFAEVDALVAKAPAIPGWTFVALQPAHGFGFEVRVGGLVFDATELTFMPLPQPDGSLAIRLLVPNPEDPEWPELGPMVVQTGLGEREAARLHHVEVGARPESSENVFVLDMLAPYLRRHAPPLP